VSPARSTPFSRICLSIAATVSLLAAPILAVHAQPPAPSASIEPAKFVFLVDYIGRDYATAVENGSIVNAFEYEEMRVFSDLLVERFDDVRTHGASDDVLTGLVDLRDQVGRLGPPARIRVLASALVERLVDELNVVALPAVAPQLDRGRRLYADNCALCHGARGGGDGPSAEGLDPPVRSFQGPEMMDGMSPRQIHAAVTFGIDGTPMPAYGGELDDEEIWDIAFLVMTMREGFNPRRPPQDLPISLDELASRSNAALLAQVRRTHPDATSTDIDYYRSVPDAAHAGAGLARPRSPRGAEVASPPGPDVQVAIQLQNAFAQVAERAAPSVVGVAGFVRSEDPPESADTGSGGSWSLEDGEGRLYPGFRQATAGSGFVVDDAGYLLTAQHVLVGPDGETVGVVDVELSDGGHAVARIVGMEPTINLAVLQLETFGAKRILARLQPARIADPTRERVGHWAIALGNPAGPGTTFSVGTLSSQPERQCYQGDLSATLIQSTAIVPAGAYGGPLVNISGEVLGITVPPPGVDVAGAAAGAVGYALPIDLAMTIFEPLKKTESRTSPWLGISVLELAAARQRTAKAGKQVQLPRTGLYIDDVFDPSPAATAGVRIGDALIAIDGHRLMSARTFQKWLYLSGIGSEVTLQIFRDGETFEKTTTITERPAAAVPR
jgi:serine protease Do